MKYNFLVKLEAVFFIFALAMLFIMYSTVYAYAAEKYIVKINSDEKDRMIYTANFEENMDCIFEPLDIYVTDKETALKLQQTGIVEYIEEDFPIYLADDEMKNQEKITVSEYDSENQSLYDDEFYYTQEWYFDLLGINEATEQLGTGKGVRIALIDTGTVEHEDLNSENIEVGYNYVKNSTDTEDLDNHGTRVIGLIAAQKNNGKGIVGIAPDVTVVPLNVISEKSGSLSNIIKAIGDAVDKYNCDVLNISVVSASYTKSLVEVIDYAIGKNVIIIAAAGNDGVQNYKYPASCENIISVGSINSNLTKSVFSQYNDFVDILAPGNRIMLLSNDGSYSTNKGTSFAAPIVSGFAVLMKEKYPDITYSEFMNILKAGAYDFGELGYDTSFGYGCLNMAESLNAYRDKNKFFISPVYVSGTESLPVKIYGEKNSEGMFVGVGYDDENRVTGIYTHNFVIDDNGIYCLEFSENYSNVKNLKFFIISDFASFTSLSEERKIYSIS